MRTVCDIATPGKDQNEATWRRKGGGGGVCSMESLVAWWSRTGHRRFWKGPSKCPEGHRGRLGTGRTSLGPLFVPGADGVDTMTGRLWKRWGMLRNRRVGCLPTATKSGTDSGGLWERSESAQILRSGSMGVSHSRNTPDSNKWRCSPHGINPMKSQHGIDGLCRG